MGRILDLFSCQIGQAECWTGGIGLGETLRPEQKPGCAIGGPYTLYNTDVLEYNCDAKYAKTTHVSSQWLIGFRSHSDNYWSDERHCMTRNIPKTYELSTNHIPERDALRSTGVCRSESKE